MPKSVVLSSAALHDLRAVVAWLTQPGSGTTAHRKRDGIAGLADDARQYQEDPDRAGHRLAIIHGYAVRFRILPDGRVFVARVFGPGQQR
jgi:plasmid stabilization system protein ParE